MSRILDLIDGYRQTRRADGYRKSGVSRYCGQIRQFAEWCRNPDPAKVGAELIQDYKESLIDRGCALETTGNALTSLNSFFAWAKAAKHVETNPVEGVKRPRRARKKPRPLTSHELTALWKALEDRVEYNEQERFYLRRNRLVILLMYYTGLRISEVAALRWSDIDIFARVLNVRDGKGGKDREVPLHPELVAVLRGALSGRRQTDAVITKGHGKPLTTKSLGHIFERWLPAAPRGVRICSHRLRHTFATMLRRNRVDLREIQELLGHEHLETTAIYTFVDDGDRASAVAKIPSHTSFIENKDCVQG
jgi:site-specific recombinase XerD